MDANGTAAPQKRRRPRVSDEEAEATMRAAGLEPLVPFVSGNTPWECGCNTCGEIVTPRYSHVKNGSSKGCKHCSRREHPGSQLRTNIAGAVAIMRAVGLEPLEDFPGANSRWRVRCEGCQKERTPRFSHVRDGRSSGCKGCAGVEVDPAHAREVMLAANLEPLEPYPGNNKAPWRVRCLVCEDECTTAYQQTRTHGTGCRTCAGRVLDPEKMAQMMRDNGFEPLTPYPTMTTSWLCRCLVCGHEAPKQAWRVRDGSGCMRCAGKILLPEEAAERMTAMGFEPLEPYPGRNTARWACTCLGCSATVRAVYKRIMRGQGAGCCNGLLDMRRPGRSMGIYLIANPTLNAVKIGVGVATFGKMSRVDQHRRRGWEVVAEWTGIPDASIAFDIETLIIRQWRADGLPAHVPATLMPQAGHTETVQRDLVVLSDLMQRVNDLLDAREVEAEVLIA